MKSKLFSFHIQGRSMSSSSKRQFGGTLGFVRLELGLELGLLEVPVGLCGCNVHSDDL